MIFFNYKKEWKERKEEHTFICLQSITKIAFQN